MSTSDGHIIRSKYGIQVEIEIKTTFGKKKQLVTFPIKILNPDGLKTNHSKNKYSVFEKLRSEFPKSFDPLILAGSHFYL